MFVILEERKRGVPKADLNNWFRIRLKLVRDLNLFIDVLVLMQGGSNSIVESLPILFMSSLFTQVGYSIAC